MRSRTATQRFVTWLTTVWLALPVFAGGFVQMPSTSNPAVGAETPPTGIRVSMAVVFACPAPAQLSSTLLFDFIESTDGDSFSKERLSAPPAQFFSRVAELDGSCPSVAGISVPLPVDRGAVGRAISLRSIQLLL